MYRGIKIWPFALPLMIGISCVKPFNPPVIESGNLNYLVVDGIIYPDSVTTIKLSRTLNLSDSFRIVPETNAELFIEAQSGLSFSFQPGADGVYTCSSAVINSGDQYRLRIKLQDEQEYLSDFEEVKISPPIDSLEWDEEGNDVSIFLNTHDPTNMARYYKWVYDETNEYKARVLMDDTSNYTCFKYYSSTNIVLGNSTELTNDVIRRTLITAVPNDNSKIQYRYSINVKQIALTVDAYKYWQNIKLNSEQNGGLFDPQPALLESNIHNINNPDEPVIGFVSVSNVTEKRIFIYGYELEHRKVDMLYCTPELIEAGQLQTYLGGGYIIVKATPDGKYYVSFPECVDCRMQGGTTERPPYW